MVKRNEVAEKRRKGETPVKKIKLVVLFLVIMVFGAACGKKEEEKTTPENLISPNTTQYDETNLDIQTVAENEFLKLSYQESTGQFTITNKKDSSEFKSITNEPATPAERSLIEIYYVDDRNNFATMYSYTEAIEKGQYQTEYLDNGIKIGLLFGEMETQVFCPPAITKERFEAIVEKIENRFDKNRFSQSYFLPDFESIPSEKAAELRQKYPNIDTEELYVLVQDNLPTSMQKEISRILVNTGYTEEDYEIDRQNAAELTQGKNAAFQLNLYLTLEENKLKARIPIEEIQEFNGGKIISITLLKNFGSPEFGEQGRFILPDGSGSLMNFYNGKGDLSPTRIPIYGLDQAVPAEEQIFEKEHAYLPVFGIQYEKQAMLGVIQDGEAFTEIRAWPGSDIAHSYVSTTFQIRQNAKTFLGSTTTGAESFTLLQKKLYDGGLEIDYYFYTKEENELSKLADSYAKILFKEGNREIESPSIYLEFIGAVYEERSEMALGGTKLESFTTIAQVKEILEDLQKEGVGPLVVRLIGFGKYGLDNTGLQTFSLNKKLGSKKELKELAFWTKEQGIELYIDVQTQYVTKTKMFDKFSKNNDVSYLISRERGMKYEYSPATFQQMNGLPGSYILNPSAVVKMIEKNQEGIHSFGEIGVSLQDAGRDLNSDFHKSRGVERQNAKKMIEEAIKEVGDNQLAMVNGANAYVLPYVDHVSRIDSKKARYDIADQSIPFLQMVLDGRLGYSDIPVNLSSNSGVFVSNSLGAGAGFTYILTGMKEKSLRQTNHSEYYSTQYEVWKEDILEKDALLKAKKQQMSGEITGFEVLDSDVLKMKYENGGFIVWNVSGVDYDYQKTTIQSGSYLMGGE